MRAVVFKELGSELGVEDVPEPTPGASDLVLRVKSCGVCGTDLHVSSLPPGLPAGTVMGHEFAGEVVEVGRQATGDFRVGDRVCALPYIGCGTCVHCVTGDGMLCASMQSTGLGALPGAYAEYVRVGANEALRLPESVGFREGALVEPLSVGLHAVKKARIAHGANVLVIGAGPVGLSVAVWARFFGARSVVVSERAAGRLELARQFGATDVIDANREEVGPAFEARAGGPPDVIFECVGVPGLLQECIGLAPHRGRIVVVGVCMAPDTIVPAIAVIKEIELAFVVAYHRDDFQLTLDMFARGRIPGAAMITDVVDLDGLPAAFEALKTPSTQCKVMIEI